MYFLLLQINVFILIMNYYIIIVYSSFLLCVLVINIIIAVCFLFP